MWDGSISEEPGVVIPHAGICAGDVGQLADLPRKSSARKWPRLAAHQSPLLGALGWQSMKLDNQIPSFLAYFVEAERILKQPSGKPTEWLQGANVLFRSYEILLREILLDVQIEVGEIWTLSKLTQEVLAQSNFPSITGQGLREIVEHRNLVAHARLSTDFTGDIFLDDLEKVRTLAVWYLRDFPKGPRFNAEKVTELLKGDEFPLPKIVFISYAREDIPYANNLYNALRNRRHKPWMDKRDLIAGQEWETEIRKAIEKADYFIALMSSKSVTKRGFVQKEIRFALDVLGEIPPGRIYSIPVRLEPCDVPDIIKHLHWVDIHDDESYSQIFRAIEHD